MRYADDLVVVCRTEAEAHAALARLRGILAELGLAPKEAKTRLVHVREGGEGFDFLGFEHRWVRARRPSVRHVTFLARWPSSKAMSHARERLRALTARERQRLSVEVVVAEVNAFLRGWAGYFRYGHSSRHFGRIGYFALSRLAIFVARRHGWSRGRGWVAVVRQPRERLGLIALPRTVSPRPLRDWHG